MAIIEDSSDRRRRVLSTKDLHGIHRKVTMIQRSLAGMYMVVDQPSQNPQSPKHLSLAYISQRFKLQLDVDGLSYPCQ